MHIALIILCVLGILVLLPFALQIIVAVIGAILIGACVIAVPTLTVIGCIIAAPFAIIFLIGWGVFYLIVAGLRKFEVKR